MNWPQQSPTFGPAPQPNGRLTDLQTERRLTILEQRLIRLHEIFSLHNQSLIMRQQQSDEDFKELREELREIYKHAWRLLILFASGTSLVIFNVMWSGTTANGF